MHLHFLADHCVPARVAESLKAAGHIVTRLRDALPPESPDENVIAKAQELEAILLTLNGDFADITAYPPANYRGIVSPRVGNRHEVLPQIVAPPANLFSIAPRYGALPRKTPVGRSASDSDPALGFSHYGHQKNASPP